MNSENSFNFRELMTQSHGFLSKFNLKSKLPLLALCLFYLGQVQFLVTIYVSVLMIDFNFFYKLALLISAVTFFEFSRTTFNTYRSLNMITNLKELRKKVDFDLNKAKREFNFGEDDIANTQEAGLVIRTWLLNKHPEIPADQHLKLAREAYDHFCEKKYKIPPRLACETPLIMITFGLLFFCNDINELVVCFTFLCTVATQYFLGKHNPIGSDFYQIKNEIILSKEKQSDPFINQYLTTRFASFILMGSNQKEVESDLPEPEKNISMSF